MALITAFNYFPFCDQICKIYLPSVLTFWKRTKLSAGSGNLTTRIALEISFVFYFCHDRGFWVSLGILICCKQSPNIKCVDC